jgi:hypothetical protein
MKRPSTDVMFLRSNTKIPPNFVKMVRALAREHVSDEIDPDLVELHDTALETKKISLDT